MRRSISEWDGSTCKCIEVSMTWLFIRRCESLNIMPSLRIYPGIVSVGIGVCRSSFPVSFIKAVINLGITWDCICQSK